MSAKNMTPIEIRRAGIDALSRGLGAVGMVRFLQQSEVGWGDYTADRNKWLENVTLTDIKANLPSVKEHRPLPEQAH